MVDALYQEIILDHYRHPEGRGLREPYEAEVHHVNPTCGDEITLRVHLAGEGDAATIEDISYDNQGCSISQASASVMYEQLLHHTVAEAMATQEQFLVLMNAATSPDADEPDEEALGDAIAFAGVAKYPARVKCALLSWMAWKDAVSQALAHGGAR
ncbi:MAG: SUF system NifU family Fe-S cluster assembly protein [Candidatus Nanopelagicales bacterium]|jgi:nitrogen fixation NifU-like protein|nr:SUF system NifU family Fe-S cluster assembly protein [Candidatus Nanopelagicales bacterium]